MNKTKSWKERWIGFTAIVWAERVKLFRYTCIGLSSLFLTSLFYYLLSSFIFPHGSHTLLYLVVIIFVSWLNYEANSYFTFEQKRSVASVGRFVGVAVIATALNAILFWIGYEVLHIWDLLVIVLNCGIVTIFTFTTHRQFTFHEKPWRHLEQLRSAFRK